jgi:hypothetical protein
MENRAMIKGGSTATMQLFFIMTTKNELDDPINNHLTWVHTD